ncbi:SAM-dependent chlorinase/fluorinase [Candidatus Bathycorpusculum sp.]|uniref:SAM hydrolase/SAM-dependent halogenase family protein n=1 Tax=Candidatus Bathycorpusculum sp. TaxID=2994959 RepID=UPI00282B2F5A|nr:S-adenosyl-l-methionine hydroxide adenosyltransferase family protein [Candidatus Termitimicrobium sp.]MCL2685171.1 S-adenosyl-l-methionine hydroxide adenosyltransferase family protein [Candidatus Termitimicrobium sp.]
MITLTTDFGLNDPYVAQMKGVIYTLNPNSKIIDITHGVDKFNICMGAFMLASVAPYFPVGTVHVAIVDPGVGTERRAIVVQTNQAFFVGPDNGILMLAAQQQDIKHVYELSNPKFRLPKVSHTFHGRDIFAPVAAHIDSGISVAEFGSEITQQPLLTPKFASIQNINGTLTGQILYVDSFGNAVTNIPSELIQSQTVNVSLPQVVLKLALRETYAQTNSKEAVALVGSHGFLELALNQDSFAKKYPVRTGDPVTVTFA